VRDLPATLDKLSDRNVQSNFEAMNALKIGMEMSKFSGRTDTMKLVEALEGLEMREGDDLPQCDRLLRKDDHQAFVREFIFDIKDGKHRILETIPKEKTSSRRTAGSRKQHYQQNSFRAVVV
jgi:hypothetical protein